jgi:hypothetical protein
MADTAFQIQYRQEFIAGFEQGLSKFRATATTEAVFKGNQATFLVADSGSATAVTRGVNGLIPSRADSLTQNTATLQEWHDKVRKTGFNIFASQGDQRRIMQSTSGKVIYRKLDDLLITELSTASNTTGTSQTGSLAMFAKAKGILGKYDVDLDEEDSMFCAISPAAEQYLLQVKEFASADYVDVKPFSMAAMGGPAIQMRRWMGVNFFVSNRLSGRTTSTEKCLMWHRDAIGLAINTGEIMSAVDYNKEEDYSFARTSVFAGVKLLQGNGVVIVNHDGSAI